MKRASDSPTLADKRAMIGHVFAQLGKPDDRRCNHTFRHARDWCEGNGIPWQPMQDWLKATGGYCDCEALLNSAARLAAAEDA